MVWTYNLGIGEASHKGCMSGGSGYVCGVCVVVVVGGGGVVVDMWWRW